MLGTVKIEREKNTKYWDSYLKGTLYKGLVTSVQKDRERDGPTA